ncbi:ATP-binding protein [Burkholderia pseudomultivorans]|uniref:ATP-binding protein n=1 Tax=Burkholderia pseudomultivorans TaxID=1207504 RepID=UPI0028743FF7|nr:ATP-binding protein [Burkholderia pseudomultivorans]MDS0793277.1 ATP-binding protein [Burkholderia pseudomultivorans]
MSIEHERQQAISALELEASTLDEIVDALSSGRPIVLPQNAGSFVLDSEDARVAFRFYASRRNLWLQQKQLSTREVDELLQALKLPKPATPSASASVSTLVRPRWRITQVRVHRFAGLHRHCAAEGLAPDILTLNLERDVTCIWGFNGAGKTALQSAIMWCLTGKAHRSQHKPAEVHEPIAAEILSPSVEDDQTLAAAEQSLRLPPIVPLPSTADLVTLQEKPCCDTWVELSLRESSGQEAVVRRELKRGDRGAFQVQSAGLEQLGLPQWAIEAGTLMPAIAATMRFDEKTTFADAVAQLTGLRPLQELGRRSERLARRLSGEDKDKAENDKDAAHTQYASIKQTFLEAWAAQSDKLGDAPELFLPEQESDRENCETAIASAISYLEQTQRRGQEDIDSILSKSVPLDTKEQALALETTLADAKECLSSIAIGTLASIETVKRLSQISEVDRESVRATLNEFSQRAKSQVAREQKKKEAARWQLYAMVSQWHRQHHPGDPVTDCPVCGSDLSTVPPDALLDKDVAEAFRISAQAHSDAAKTLQEWQRDAARELSEAIPSSFKPFLDTKLPGSLLELYRNAYVDELLRDQAFNTQLRPLKSNAVAVWDLAVSAHPLTPVTAIETIELPKELQGHPLATRFINLQAAMTLSLQRQVSETELRLITQRYFGGGTFNRTETTQQPEMSTAPLRHQVQALQQAVTSSEPIINLLRQLREIENTRRNWRQAHDRLLLLRRAAAAVEQFTKFPDLVHRQVEGLIQVLDERTKAWLDTIYRPHYVGGPAYRGLDPSRTQGIGIYAGVGSLRVHAHEVMNSSHLRACVWAFVFSLWERIRDRAGALEVLQLDDPQTYFDPINTENLAAAIPALVAAGMAPIVTSNDNRFIAAVKSKLPKLSSDSPSWTMLQISPISSSRSTAALIPSVDEVFERRDVWRADESDTRKAQEFVERVRLYIENRLWDLLAADPMLIYKPTLADLINHISSARNGGEHPFNEPPFERLVNCKSLKSGSPFYTTINSAHHNLSNVTPYDASKVDQAFDEVDRLLRSCSASYARFMGRLTREDEDLFFAVPPPAPTATVLKGAPIAILGEFSARTYSDAIAIDGGLGSYSLDSLGDVALFAIRSSSLGALALPGQLVIASLSARAKSGDPVIVLYSDKVMARRYHTDQNDPARLTFTCDQSATEKVAPALTLQRAKVRVLPIVGILYENAPRAGAGEAQSVDQCSVLDKPLVAARITEDSGYPVVRNGDLVLMEHIPIPDSPALDRMKGDMVTFVASCRGEQFAYLKRVGPAIQGNLRIFENVGTFGDSLAVSCHGTDEVLHSGLEMQRMWRVHGVIRTKS